MRPSQLLDIGNEYVAYCLDDAVAVFGSAVTAELEAQEGKSRKAIETKQARVIERMVGTGPGGKPRFRTPVATKGKGVKSE